jgi:hypothetical protein
MSLFNLLIIADVGPFVGVGQFVGSQQRTAFKGLVTNVAGRLSRKLKNGNLNQGRT